MTVPNGLPSGHVYVMKTYTPGTVLTYTPDDNGHDRWWCREGMAVVNENGAALDTYWNGGGVRHRLTESELATAEVDFHLDDVDEMEKYPAHNWMDYPPEDRFLLHSQHHLQNRRFIRKGARPSLAVKIENAREKLAGAIDELARAEGRVEWARQDLAALLALRDGAALEA